MAITQKSDTDQGGDMGRVTTPGVLQSGMTLIVLVAGVLLSGLMAGSILSGFWPLTVVTVWLTSIGAMAVARWYERRRAMNARAAPSFSALFSPKFQSWAFLFGDPVFLALALAVATDEWALLPEDAWYHQSWWWMVSLTLGAIFALVFRGVDAQNYYRSDAIAALQSATKLTHDAVTVWVLASGMIFTGIPLLIEVRSGALVLYLVGLLSWVVLGIFDVVRGPMCFERHPAWNTGTCRPR